MEEIKAMFTENKVTMTLEDFIYFRDAMMNLDKIRTYAEDPARIRTHYNGGGRYVDVSTVGRFVIEMFGIQEDLPTEKEGEA